MIDAVHAFADEAGPAGRLAGALGAGLRTISHHVFPDGESLPRVTEAAGTVVLYRSLWRPDDKIVPLLLAADALRRRGAARVILAAPYLCYLRQDIVFRPGEPLSRDVIGALLGERFEAVVTVEPHLHRTRDLSAVFAGTATQVVSAAPALARALAPADPATVVVGPDEESTPWAAALAQALGLTGSTALRKTRRGDRDISLALDHPAAVAGAPVILLDDICASGATLEGAIGLLKGLGAGPIDVAVAHALFDTAAAARLTAAGARRIISTDSCPHPTNQALLAGDLAEAVKRALP